MSRQAHDNGVEFRPHFKTHQSAAIGQWFREAGISRITVSSLKMAQEFMQQGWNDIFIAFPVNLLELDQINQLAGKVQLLVSVDSEESAVALARHIRHPLGICLKIDTGYHRSGLDPTKTDRIAAILGIIKQSPQLSFIGFYTHDGHTYHAESTTAIVAIAEQSRNILMRLKDRFVGDYPELILSVGDTPSCSLERSFEGIDEIRPGNFTFYDLMQWKLNVCSISDIAVVLECPVVSKSPDRKEMVIHGGAVHLSKESLHYEGNTIYGLVVPMTNSGWGEPLANAFVSGLSQEHGIISCDQDTLNHFQVGDTLGILPVHSCLTANLASYYLDLQGNIIPKFRS